MFLVFPRPYSLLAVYLDKYKLDNLLITEE